MTTPFSRAKDEQGITLIELLAVVALMGLVFGAISVFLGSTYSTYQTTSEISENQRVALVIIDKVTQEIRQSVGDEEFQVEPVVSDIDGFTITTQLEPLKQVVFTSKDGTVTYTDTDGTSLTLSKQAEVRVNQDAAEPKQYEIIVKVGAENDKTQITMTTTVTRYNWGK